MKKRSVRLILCLILSIGLSFTHVFATGISYKFDESVKEQLDNFFLEYQEITSQVQYDPSVDLNNWKINIQNYTFNLREKSGHMAAGEFFRNLAISIGEERIREGALRIEYDYIDFSVRISPSTLTGFFYKNNGSFVALMIRH